MVQADSLINKPKQKLIIISGPTAVGKTDVSLNLAQEINSEIISADSMQIYKKLDIGTGKITAAQMRGIRHWLIDIKNPNEEYSVGEFVSDCKQAIEKIASSGKIPIVVGGTGLYINALINGYNLCTVPKSEELREKLKIRAEQEGVVSLYEELIRIDSAAAKKIMPNDLKRIIRALEIFYVSGKTKSENESFVTESEYDYLFFILEKEREKLYEDINNRVAAMFTNGLVEEVKSLIEYKNCQSMQAIGYKEIVSAIENNEPVEKALFAVQQNSRHYAKRQITYFKGIRANKLFIKSNEYGEILIKTKQFISDVSNIVQ